MGGVGGDGDNDAIATAGVSSRDIAAPVAGSLCALVHTHLFIISSDTSEYESGVIEPSARGRLSEGM